MLAAVDALGPAISAVVAIAGIVLALFKLRPEQESLTAAASKTAVEVFNATVKSLQDDLIAAKQEIVVLEQERQRLKQEHERAIRTIERERDASVGENYGLRRQVTTLEVQVRRLRGQDGKEK